MNASCVQQNIRGKLFKGEVSNIFPTQEATHNPYITTNTELFKILKTLHNAMKMNENVQDEIDRYLVVCSLEYQRSSILKQLDWKDFVLNRDNILKRDDLLDIALYVRQTICMTHISGCESFQCILQYSMPFIKHNRLTIPNLKNFRFESLIALAQIVLACCLGIISPNSKKPTFRNRVILFANIHTMITRGTKIDLYEFLVASINLVRVSLMEYFFVFCEKYMPLELSILVQSFAKNENLKILSSQIKSTVDHFRQAALQTEIIEWRAVNLKAQMCNDKCNRICKNKFRMNSAASNAYVDKNTQPHIFNLATHTRSCAHIFYLKNMNPQISYNELAVVQRIHNSIVVHTIPRNLFDIQASALKKSLKINTITQHNCTILKFCGLCTHRKGAFQGHFRFNSSLSSFCDSCNSSDYIISINMLGKILKLYNTFYFFCICCLKVHPWQYDGSPFSSQCPLQSKITSQQKLHPTCHFCMRDVNLTPIHVIDENIGFMHTLLICNKHYPWTYQLPFIKTTCQLMFFVRNKFVKHHKN